MKTKIKNALKQGYKEQLGLGDEAFERAATFGATFITSEDQIAAFVTAAEPMLKAEQSAADRVRTELSAKIKGLEGEKAELEAKLNGNQTQTTQTTQTQSTDDDKVPVWAQALIDSNKALNEKLAGFEAERNAKTALTSAETIFKGNDYVKKYTDEATDAWERATEMYEATGKSWTAEQLQEKAMGYFSKAVFKKGVDTSKPFENDRGGKAIPDFKNEVEILKSEGIEMPE